MKIVEPGAWVALWLCEQPLRFNPIAMWFIGLGMEPVYSDPGHPEQNGRHERMHRELKGEAMRPLGFDLRVQQWKLNEFAHHYNEFRPHDACGRVPPGRGIWLRVGNIPRKPRGGKTQRNIGRGMYVAAGRFAGVMTSMSCSRPR